MPAKPKVLLVGWDAADWEHIEPLLEKGQLPTLQKLLDNGVMGNLGTLHPVLSPMLWNSIATGKHAHKHGIFGFVEPDPTHGGARPYSSVSRRTKALWNILSQSGLRCNVVNWWASHPAEPVNGCIVSNSFAATRFEPGKGFVVPRGTVHPADRAERLGRNRVYPGELTGEQLLPFVPRGKELNQDEDHRLSMLADNLADMLSTHAVATDVMEHEPWDFMAVYYTAVDHFAHAFMVFHPPRLPWISEADFEMFKDVMAGVYRFSDMALARMLQLSGPETTVILCSDHGFQSRDGRLPIVPNEPSAPAYWHRQFGVFLASGPNIKKDERVYGAGLLDVAPTVLSIFGLPIGKDMDGRPLLEIFEKPPEVKYVDSWDKVEGDSGRHTGEPMDVSEQEKDEILKQLVALGYIEAPGSNKEEQREFAEIECRFNHACNLGWTGHLPEAIEMLRQLVVDYPWESRFIDELLTYLRRSGNGVMVERLITAAFDVKATRSPGVLLAWIDVLISRGEREKAGDLLLEIERRTRRSADILNQVGFHFLRLRRMKDAYRVYKAATERNADNAEAWQGLSSAACRLGLNQETVDAATRALRLVFRLPKAHLNIGIAMARAGQPEEARTALETALKFNNNVRKAHRWLALIYGQMKQPAKVSYHMGELHRIAAQTKAAAARSSSAHPVFELPAIPSELERAKIIKQKRPMPTSISARTGKTFVLVSGLPRSGTSLMMQILEAGGLLPKTDGQRTADVDNPKGYYEWEDIKQIAAKPHLLDEEGLEKKAIKCIAALLPQMPFRHEYKVIFMTRPIDEVIKSQSAMISNRGSDGAQLSDEQLAAGLTRHRDEILHWLGNHPRAKFIEVDYPSLVKSPDEHVKRIIDFVGPDLLPDAGKMRAVVDASLYRNRSKKG